MCAAPDKRFRSWLERRRLRRALRVVARHLVIEYGPMDFDVDRTDAERVMFGMRQEIQFSMSETLKRVDAAARERIGAR